ncbi:MAG: hypothetical protein GYA50_09685 [Eubacteriaceae bacterium]|nr:hypothetical protein [Eubacteriaceae bacterium]
MDWDLLSKLVVIIGSWGITAIIIFGYFFPVIIKPKRKAKKLYLKVMEQYHPLGALRIWIQYEGKGALKNFPFERKQCYLLLYDKELSVVTIDEPLIRVNIPHNYFQSYRIVKDNYIKFYYVENNRDIEIELKISSSDRVRENFNKYALKQFDYFKYFETHIPTGDQSPTIINL